MLYFLSRELSDPQAIELNGYSNFPSSGKGSINELRKGQVQGTNNSLRASIPFAPTRATSSPFSQPTPFISWETWDDQLNDEENIQMILYNILAPPKSEELQHYSSTSWVTLKDKGERNFSQLAESKTALLIFHFAWKERCPKVWICIVLWAMKMVSWMSQFWKEHLEN